MTVTAAEPTTQGWTADDSTFGARLALIRQRMGWNIKEAALACSIAPATWKNWEAEGMSPRKMVETCRQIAARSGCNAMWLLTGSADGSIRTTAYGLPRLIDRDRPQSPASRPSTYGASRRPHESREGAIQRRRGAAI